MPAVRIAEEPLGVARTTLYEVVDEAGECVSGPRLVVLGAIHGNETVGLDNSGQDP